MISSYPIVNTEVFFSMPDLVKVDPFYVIEATSSNVYRTISTEDTDDATDIHTFPTGCFY